MTKLRGCHPTASSPPASQKLSGRAGNCLFFQERNWRDYQQRGRYWLVQTRVWSQVYLLNFLGQVAPSLGVTGAFPYWEGDSYADLSLPLFFQSPKQPGHCKKITVGGRDKCGKWIVNFPFCKHKTITKIAVFLVSECLICARHHASMFMCMIPYKLHGNANRWILLKMERWIF